MKQMQHERVLGLGHLMLYGLGCTIGTGIFVVTGEASKLAGPAVCISYAISGLVTLPTAFVFSELVSRIPLKGSCYSYIYCSYGELTAFLVGWSMFIRFTGAAATLCRSWSSYLVKMLAYLNI